jgi:hypothetical protein
LTALTALPAGLVLGIGGPKRLTLTIVAAGSISAAGVADDAQLGLAVLYVVVAGLLVWVPVLAYVLAGRRADALLDGAQVWLAAKQRTVAIWSLLVVGVVLVVDGSVRLL